MCALLTCLLALLGILQPAYSQDSSGVDKSTYSGRLLTDVLGDLQQKGLQIIYSSELVRPWMRVRETPAAGPPAEILQEILSPHGLKAVEGPGQTWLVVQAPPDSAAAGAIWGQVSDSHDGEPLARVAVAVLGTGSSGTTAADGRFAFSGLEPGRYDIEFHAAGYISHRMPDIEVTVDSTTSLDVQLQVVDAALENITVVGSQYRLLTDEVGGGRFVTREELDQIPHLTDDLFRAARRIPGIASDDISARLHVRGGNKDESFLMLDGLELFNPFHLKDLGGIFGIVDSNIVDSLDILSGGYTAEYGDGMSGVMDATTLHLSDTSETSLGVSFVNAFARTQQNFDDGRGRWMVSVRRGYLDWLFSEASTGDTEFTPRYWDILAKFEYDFTNFTTLHTNVLLASDDMTIEDVQGSDVGRSDGQSDSVYLWAALSTDWSEKLYSNTIFSVGNLDRTRLAVVLEDGSFNGMPIVLSDILVDDRRSLDFFGVRTDWVHVIDDRNMLKWGLDARHYDADYDYELQSTISHPFWTDLPVDNSHAIVSNPDGDQYAIYLAYRRRLTESLLAEVGLRWDKQTYTDIDDDDQYSPRINLLYELGPSTDLRAAWGRFYQSQGINELQVEDNVDVFFPAEQADHVVLGMTHRFNSGLTLRTDLYRKEYDNLRPRFENALDPHEIIPEANPDRIMISPDSAEARGIEILFRQSDNPVFNWWVGYVWSEVFDTINGIDVPRSWDQRHAATTNFNWRWAKWNWNLAGVYHTGWPRTPIDFDVEFDSSGAAVDADVVFGPRNSENYDDYFRLDTRLSRDVAFENSELTYYVEIYNIFDKENPCCVDGLGVSVSPTRVVTPMIQVDTGMTRLYSFGVSWTF